MCGVWLCGKGGGRGGEGQKRAPSKSCQVLRSLAPPAGLSSYFSHAAAWPRPPLCASAFLTTARLRPALVCVFLPGLGGCWTHCSNHDDLPFFGRGSAIETTPSSSLISHHSHAHHTTTRNRKGGWPALSPRRPCPQIRPMKLLRHHPARARGRRRRRRR